MFLSACCPALPMCFESPGQLKKKVGCMAWKWIHMSLESWMVSWYKDKIAQAGVSNCMRLCLNFLVLNEHIPRIPGLIGEVLFSKLNSFFAVCQS